MCFAVIYYSIPVDLYQLFILIHLKFVLLCFKNLNKVFLADLQYFQQKYCINFLHLQQLWQYFLIFSWQADIFYSSLSINTICYQLISSLCLQNFQNFQNYLYLFIFRSLIRYLDPIMIISSILAIHNQFCNCLVHFLSQISLLLIFISILGQPKCFQCIIFIFVRFHVIIIYGFSCAIAIFVVVKLIDFLNFIRIVLISYLFMSLGPIFKIIVLLQSTLILHQLFNIPLFQLQSDESILPSITHQQITFRSDVFFMTIIHEDCLFIFEKVLIVIEVNYSLLINDQLNSTSFVITFIINYQFACYVFLMFSVGCVGLLIAL